MKKSNYIAGQWVEGISSIKNINPSDTSETIDEYTSCTDEQFEQAIQSAATAQREWEKVGIEKKSQILIKIGDELIQKSKKNWGIIISRRGETIKRGYWGSSKSWPTISVLRVRVFAFIW